MALLVTVKETNALVKGGIIQRSNVNLLLKNHARLPPEFMDQVYYKFILYSSISSKLFFLEVHGLFFVYKSISIFFFNFVDTPRNFIIAKLSIRKLGSSSVLIKSDLF